MLKTMKLSLFSVWGIRERNRCDIRKARRLAEEGNEQWLLELTRPFDAADYLETESAERTSYMNACLKNGRWGSLSPMRLAWLLVRVA